LQLTRAAFLFYSPKRFLKLKYPLAILPVYRPEGGVKIYCIVDMDHVAIAESRNYPPLYEVVRLANLAYELWEQESRIDEYVEQFSEKDIKKETLE
jgi:hypothetical protein